MDLEVWGCPVCLARISPGNDGVVCTREGRRFPLLNGLPVLLRPEDTSLLEDSERYSAAWIRETWTPSKTDLVRLPYIPHGQWRQKARSLKVLLRLLGPPKGRIVADMGAGTGWLSHRLSEAGFRCFATDLSTDLVVGLGAAEAFSGTSGEFERAVASLERWPFQNGTIDVAVCNASLHYLAEIGPALREAARVLRPGGEFVAMNDPVQRDRRSAERAAKEFSQHLPDQGGSGRLLDGHRHFVALDLEDELSEVFANVRRHDPDYGLWFRATRAAKGLLLRMELASFPIYTATRTR